MPKPLENETRRKKRYGRCRICNKFKRLTKEHVPPQKALNDGSFLIHSVKEDENLKRVRLTSKEKEATGIYVFSLCEECNNKTGRQYGRDYVEFVKKVSTYAVPANVNIEVPISIPKFFPLRVVKQVTSMMLSTSKPTNFRDHQYVSAPGITKEALAGIELNFPSKSHQAEIYERLRLFVKTRDKARLPDGVHLYLFASVGRRLGFQTGIFSRINLTTKNVAWTVVTGLYPVHWAFSFDSELDEDVLNITNWADYSYKQEMRSEINVPMRWVEGSYPLDFRSPEDLYITNFINSMRFEGFIPSADAKKERVLAEAHYFARKLGKATKKGYIISSFRTGVFYEFGLINGWLEGADSGTAIRLLEYRLLHENSN